MDKRDRNEQAFETLLAENLPAPPETVVAGVTPGHRALRRVLWGSALCTVTLQVSGLQYILPTVGLVLLLLGFRALRRENRWFCAGFRLCGAWFACAAAGLALRAAIAPETASSWLGYAAAALELAVFLCLWRGLDAVQRKAGLPSGKSAAALFFWYVLLVALTFARPNVGWLFAAVILAAYLCVLRSLFRLTRVLDESGYAVRPAAVRVPDRVARCRGLRLGLPPVSPAATSSAGATRWTGRRCRRRVRMPKSERSSRRSDFRRMCSRISRRTISPPAAARCAW